jgi:hypothetical protein
MSAEQERHLRSKMSDDSSTIVRENSVLHQQVVEMTKQLERVSLVLSTPNALIHVTKKYMY